jgi:D-glycero-D-manno-heptose 1,7-bisphosphate phosphatase
MKRAVFLDRDGVLNRSPMDENGRSYPPFSVAETEILPGTAEALKRLKELGFLLLVVSNQPDVARGVTNRETAEAINAYLKQELGLDEFFVCYHTDEDHCGCRKPKPGLILQAAEKYGIDCNRSYMIGDRWRDVDAGGSAGCTTLQIQYHYKERGPDHTPQAEVDSLPQAVEWILARERSAR